MSGPSGVVGLDELETLVVIDSETDRLSSLDEGVPRFPEVVRLRPRRISASVT